MTLRSRIRKQEHKYYHSRPRKKHLSKSQDECDIHIVEKAPVMECKELCLIEGSNFVGATATFDGGAEWNIVSSPVNRLPSG